MQRTPRLYVYISGSMVVRRDAALSTVIERLRDAGIEVVDYDELSRRVVFRAASRLAGILSLFLRRYAESHVVEVKASAKLRRLNPPEGARYVRVGGRLLFYLECGAGDWGVWGEHRAGRLLLKLCRRGGQVDPAMLPPGLCLHPGGEPEALLEAARRCFEEALARAGLGST